MSYTVSGNTITMTRGDTVKITVSLKYKGTGQTYTPQEGDEISFTAINSGKREITLTKTVPTDTMMLSIAPADTKQLPFGLYMYDMQIKFANGDIDTFITDGALYINEERSE